MASACKVVEFAERRIDRRFERAGMQVEHVDRDGLHVAYQIHRASSDGTDAAARHPLVLVHGFGASAKWQWPDQVGPLAEGRTLVVPDLLGFGGSYSQLARTSVDDQVAALAALLDELELRRVDLVGISYGGIVSYELAAAHPGRVRKLVMIDSPGRSYSPADYAAMCARFGVQSAAEFLLPREPDGVQTLLELAYFRPPRPPAWAREQIYEALYAPERLRKLPLIEALERDMPELTARPAIDTSSTADPIEALVIWGAHDEVFLPETGRELAASVDAEFVEIERSKHAPPLERHRQVNRALLEFLDAG